MSFDNGMLCKVSLANVLDFRTRSRSREGVQVERVIHDITPSKERWVRKEDNDGGYWIEQVNPCFPATFGEARWVPYLVVEV